MDDEKIVLKANSPEWAVSFEQEAKLLKHALPDQLITAHHVGSTAIASIRAKPIIDIAVESATYPPSKFVNLTLAELGYTSHGESNVPGRCWFSKGIPREFNLHWCPRNGTVVRAQVRFRDALRENSNLANEYELLKFKAAEDRHIDSSEYAKAKSDFILKVLAK